MWCAGSAGSDRSHGVDMFWMAELAAAGWTKSLQRPVHDLEGFLPAAMTATR
jgi:hypothetical protein